MDKIIIIEDGMNAHKYIDTVLPEKNSKMLPNNEVSKSEKVGNANSADLTSSNGVNLHTECVESINGIKPNETQNDASSFNSKSENCSDLSNIPVNFNNETSEPHIKTSAKRQHDMDTTHNKKIPRLDNS